MSGRAFSRPAFPGDDGSADPAVAAALAAFAAGEGGEHALLTALAASRLLVPVVAAPPGAMVDDHGHGEEHDHGHGRRPQMAMPTIVGHDGRRAALGFTSLATLRRWRADARPLPLTTRQACATAVEEGWAALVVDVAGPITYPVEGARLTSLAAGEPPPEPCRDPDVLNAVYAATAPETEVARVAVRPPADPTADLTLRLELHVELSRRRRAALARRVTDRLAAALPGRLPRGVELSVVSSAQAARGG